MSRHKLVKNIDLDDELDDYDGGDDYDYDYDGGAGGNEGICAPIVVELSWTKMSLLCRLE